MKQILYQYLSLRRGKWATKFLPGASSSSSTSASSDDKMCALDSVKKLVVPTDVVVCVLTTNQITGEESLIQYPAHKHVLRANSHYFKQLIVNGKMDDFYSLPFPDTYDVFSLLLRWMYEKSSMSKWSNNVVAYVAHMAYQLGMAQPLYSLRRQLVAERTQNIIQYLTVAHDELTSMELVVPLVHALARRVGVVPDNELFALPIVYMDLVLRSSDLDILKVPDIYRLLETYATVRETKYKDKLNLADKHLLQTAATNLSRLRKLIIDLKDNPVDYKSTIQRIQDAKHNYIEQISHGEFDPDKFYQKASKRRMSKPAALTLPKQHSTNGFRLDNGPISPNIVPRSELATVMSEANGGFIHDLETLQFSQNINSAPDYLPVIYNTGGKEDVLPQSPAGDTEMFIPNLENSNVAFFESMTVVDPLSTASSLKTSDSKSGSALISLDGSLDGVSSATRGRPNTLPNSLGRSSRPGSRKARILGPA